MPASKTKSLAFIALALGGSGAALALWLDADRRAEEPVEVRSRDPLALALELQERRAAEVTEPDLMLVPRETADETAAPTSVIWPLEVQLTQVSRAAFERIEDEPLGGGASAALEGHVWGGDDRGLRAQVTFTAGPNSGRVLVCDSEGALGATDLYPGLAIVRIETPNGLLAEREVRLRARQTELLNIGFGRPSPVFGKVVDFAGEALAGAEVTLDGHRATSDEEGGFYFPAIASGLALATCSKHGYALYRETVPVTAGRVIERERLQFRLLPGANLELHVEGNAGDLRSPALVYLFPLGQGRVDSQRGQRTYPWHLVSPVETWPGGTKLIEGLPEGNVMLSIFRPGAVAERAQVKVRLYEGQTVKQVLKLLPGARLEGRVVRGEHPIEGALVRLEAPNRQATSEAVLGKTPEFNQELIFPHLPSAVQEMHSDVRGGFQFTLFPELGRAAYLTAETSDGAWRASRSVALPVEGEIELELQPVSAARGTIEIGTGTRFQALPISIRVMGAPRDPFELAPREALVVDDLEAGTWRLDVSWNREKLIEKMLVDVSGEEPVSIEVELPQGAIAGQTEEERRRAAR